MRKFKLVGATVAMVTIAAVVFTQNPKTAYAVTNDEISDAVEDLEDAKEKLEEIKSEMADLSANITDVQSYIQVIDAKVAEYTEKIIATGVKITNKQNEIDAKKKEIAEKEKDIENKKASIQAVQNQQRKDYDSMKLRIQYMYECGDDTFLENIFSSESLSDMLGKTEYVNTIVEYDRKQLEVLADREEQMKRMLEDLEADKEQLKKEKAILDKQKAVLTKLDKALENERAYVDEILSSKKQTLDKLRNQENNMEELKAQYEKEIAEKQATLDEIRRQWEEERRKYEEMGYNVDEMISLKLQEIGLSGGLSMPISSRINGHYYISSVFGISRYIPEVGIWGSNHSGVDFVGPSGEPIYAVYDGTVETVQKNSGGYGWHVVINHGGGIKSLYGHMSGFNVCVGQKVLGGQQIGVIGSTGQSTGPHLHLTMYAGGDLIDPLQFYSTSAVKAAEQGLTGYLPDQMSNYKGIPFEFAWNVYY